MNYRVKEIQESFYVQVEVERKREVGKWWNRKIETYTEWVNCGENGREPLRLYGGHIMRISCSEEPMAPFNSLQAAINKINVFRKPVKIHEV